MNKFIGIAAVVFLCGCADTPKNRELWNAIGQGLQGAGQELNRQAEEIRRSSVQTQASPMPLPQQTRCTTRYNSLFKEYETVCQ